MLLAAALMLQAAPAPAVNDIVVTALRKLRLSTDIDGRTVRGCTVRVSSGDAAIDSEACAATTRCIGQGVADSELLANCVDRDLRAYVRNRSD
jgi:hypothetical protein